MNSYITLDILTKAWKVNYVCVLNKDNFKNFKIEYNLMLRLDNITDQYHKLNLMQLYFHKSIMPINKWGRPYIYDRLKTNIAC